MEARRLRRGRLEELEAALQCAIRMLACRGPIGCSEQHGTRRTARAHETALPRSDSKRNETGRDGGDGHWAVLCAATPKCSGDSAPKRCAAKPAAISTYRLGGRRHSLREPRRDAAEPRTRTREPGLTAKRRLRCARRRARAVTSFVLCADKNALPGSSPSAALCAYRGGVRALPAASASATVSAHAPAPSAAALRLELLPPPAQRALRWHPSARPRRSPRAAHAFVPLGGRPPPPHPAGYSSGPTCLAVPSRAHTASPRRHPRNRSRRRCCALHRASTPQRRWL